MGKGFILLIDDDEEFREVMHDFLESMGFVVQGVGSLAAARPLFMLGPAVAVVDWSLGDATGADVVRALHRDAPECVILVASGYGATVTQEVAGLLHGVMRKPFKLRDLVTTIRGLMDP